MKVIKVKKVSDASEHETSFKIVSSIVTEQLKMIPIIEKHLRDAEMAAKGVDDVFAAKMKDKKKIASEIAKLMRSLKG